jgi:hypothetical protein
MALNWDAKTIRQITRRKALERWESKLGNCKVTPQALCSIANSLTKRDEPKAPTAFHGPLGITCHPDGKARVIAEYSENQIISHFLWDETRERQVETTVQSLVASVDDIPMGKVRPCDIH